MPHRSSVIICGLLIALSAISTDILLPAVWDLSAAFNAPIGAAQAVTPLFLFSVGFGQLIFGPASDRYGRRPVLIVGLTLYVAAAVVAALAGSIEIVLLARAVQGFGAAAGVAVGRAALRDLHSGDKLAQAMALATSLVAIGPVLAPIVGAALISFGSWRAIFYGMIALGLCLLAVAMRVLPETNTSPDPSALKPHTLMSNLRRTFAHPQSRFHLLLATLCGFQIVCFLTHVPRLLRGSFGVEAGGLVTLFAAMGLAIVAGQMANRHLIRWFGALGTARLGAVVLAAAALTILVLHLCGGLTFWLFGSLMVAFNTSYLVVMANAFSLAIDPHKAIAGLVASIYGFLTMVVPAALAMATLPLIAGEMLPWSVAMVLVSSSVLAGLLWLAPSTASTSGKVAPHPQAAAE